MDGQRVENPIGFLRDRLQEPSPGHWLEILHFFSAWPKGAEAERETALGYAGDHIDQWPPELASLPPMNEKDFCALAPDSAQMRLVRHLCLVGALSQRVLDDLMHGPLKTRLRGLSLRDARLGLGALERLLEAIPAGQLRLFELTEYRFNATETEAMVHAEALSQLEYLGLERCNLGLKGLKVLLGSSWRLRGLNLSNGKTIGRKGAGVLARAEQLQDLEELRLPWHNIGRKGTLALVSSPWLKKLRVLDLSRNNIGAGGVSAIAYAPNMTSLEELRLCHNGLDANSAKVLVGAPCLPSLKLLHFHGNAIYDRVRMPVVPQDNPFADAPFQVRR